MPRERPAHVLPDELRRMVLACTQRADYRRAAGRVAQPDGEVAQPALVADAPDRRAAQPLVELGLAPREQLDQRGLVQPIARFEVLFIAQLRKSIPRTHDLAVVAAVHPVADERAQLLRGGALVLDGEVRDAAPRIELVGRADRLRRADVDAALAAAAVIVLRRIGRQRQVAIDLAQEEPRARIAVEEQRVLAAPAQARALRQLDLDDRSRIGEGAVAERPDLPLDALAQRLQARGQHLVIIAAAGIPGDRCPLPVGLAAPRALA